MRQSGAQVPYPWGMIQWITRCGRKSGQNRHVPMLSARKEDEMQKTICLMLICSVLLAGCAFHRIYRGGADYVILDAPAIDEFGVDMGTEIHIHAHTNLIDEGLQMYVEVNGAVVRSLDIVQQLTNPPLTEGDGTWTPIDPMPPGDYRLRVLVIAGSTRLSSRTCLIHVYPATTPTSAFSLPAQPNLTASVIPIPSQATSTPTASPTSTISPPIEINFWADFLSIEKGSCTQLHWQVKHASWVTINGSTVSPTGDRQVCPEASITYTLQAGSMNDQVERTLVIQVITSITPTPDIFGPTIENMLASSQKVYWPPNCTPAEVTISATVRDTSGVESVLLFYRLVDGKRQGKWLQKIMNLSASQTYATTLYYKDFMLSLNPPVESGSMATLQYYVIATDQIGNRSQSKPYADVLIQYCE